ncbi:hypothetical protein IEQ34_021450 [Dendrobium chrysotoxum]|uniref:Uncharacterized protein n=1 Tax=Dendrobium chrysotoxum TaxID=161865 RepID=A0AAV7G511_DENCH|nr:hypothetical protein IEQ34_021450 [Dendrobium chrysotoxum]
MEELTLMEESPKFLLRVVIFLAVQVLVYLILSKSSCIFSTSKKISRSFSFRPARSASIRSMLAAISDLPAAEFAAVTAADYEDDDRKD